MAATKPAFNPPGKKGDMIFSALVKLAALIVLLMLGGIIVSLIISSWPSIEKFGFSFLWTKEWDAPNDIYGALVPIYGTLVTSFIALLIAVPVSFGIALFLTELAPGWLRRPLGIAIELLAGYPQHRLRHVGPVYLRAAVCHLVPGTSREYSFQHSVCWRTVLRPGILVSVFWRRASFSPL
ncbi:phosphate transporter permease subunit PstC [Citrobacter koseri]|uniref:Phosphate transporter permease subunit PstC n=1 Tax=Citrobacter koseri TaxID=545 RepID=A0A3S5DNZ2_CITKO|nr:phosphate transporter permease subunit PstC [Citrobacter koseri]